MKFKSHAQRKAVMAKVIRFPKTRPIMYIQKPEKTEAGYKLGVIPVGGKKTYAIEDEFTLSRFPNKISAEKEFKSNVKIERKRLIDEMQEYPSYAVPSKKYLRAMPTKELKEERIRLKEIFKR